MFAKPRIKKSALAVPPKKRRKVSAVEEVVFDNTARHEYLTGFHKRKLQRQKVAQEEAAERERQERIELRKQVKADRLRQVEDHVAKVNEFLREAAVAGNIDGDEAQDTGDEEWGGIPDALPDQPLDMEEEYIDEDRYTSVTVESVAVTRHGLEKPVESDEEADGDEDPKSDDKTAPAKRPSKPKKKKPKFRYESKVERKMERKKQKAKKLAKRKD